MSLADYVARKYLNPDSLADKRPKKRKREQKTTLAGGIHIADDDATVRSASPENDDLEVGLDRVNGHSTEFRKSKKSNWASVAAPAQFHADHAAADAIIASTAAEKNLRNLVEEYEPQIFAVKGNIIMESGADAGLQSAAKMSADVERRKAEERRRFQMEGAGRSGKDQETIYRDASGRIINVAMKRAEARRKAEEMERKKSAEIEAGKGDVQRAEKEMRKQALADAKYMSVARYADDVNLNDELKERERWNDPAAQFLTEKKSAKSVTGKPLYQGAAPPNRYGIRPGHRWDGVDRSNDFEKEYFAAQNRKQSTKDLKYQWEYDV